jgi:hypothetical protein
MSRSAYTLSLHQFQVGVDSGTIVSNQAVLDAIDLPLADLNNLPFLSACASRKVGKLYFVDMRSQRHRAFDALVEDDSGFIIDDRAVAQSINDLNFAEYSMYSGMTAYNVGKLYFYTPLSTNVNTNSATLNVTGVNTTSKYRIADVPVIKAQYITDTNIQVTALNRKSAYKIRFYEAEGIANNFSNIQNVTDENVDSFTFTHNTNTIAYKYKVSYFVTGNIGGVETEFEGTRCQPSYLLGE